MNTSGVEFRLNIFYLERKHAEHAEHAHVSHGNKQGRVRSEPEHNSFLQSSHIRVDLLSYESKLTDKRDSGKLPMVSTSKLLAKYPWFLLGVYWQTNHGVYWESTGKLPMVSTSKLLAHLTL